jgi:hypothetical protein
LDSKLDIRFKPSFLILLGQMQAGLVILVAYFPMNTGVVLAACFTVDVVLALALLFWGKDQHCKLGACYVGSINKYGAVAFFLSAFLNVCSFIALVHKNDTAASIAFFGVLFITTAAIIHHVSRALFCSQSSRFFDKARVKNLKTALKNHFYIRAIALFSNMTFWNGEVRKFEDNKPVRDMPEWSIIGQCISGVLLIECACVVACFVVIVVLICGRRNLKVLIFADRVEQWISVFVVYFTALSIFCAMLHAERTSRFSWLTVQSSIVSGAMAVRGLLIKRAIFLAKKQTFPVDDPVPTLLLQAQDTTINVTALAELRKQAERKTSVLEQDDPPVRAVDVVEEELQRGVDIDERFSISGDKAPLIWASYTSPYAQVLGLLMSVERSVGSIATFTVCGKQIPRPLCCQMNLLEAIDEELFMAIGPKKTICKVDFKRALLSQRRAQDADQSTVFRLIDSMANSGGDISCAGFGVMLATMKMKTRTVEPEIFMKGGSATFTKDALEIALGSGKMKAVPQIFRKGGSATFTKRALKSSPAADWENPDLSLLKKLCDSSATDGQIECAAFGATLEIGRLAQRAACSGSRGRWVCMCVGASLYNTDMCQVRMTSLKNS